MKIRASPWLLLSSIVFTFNTIYWYIRNPEETILIVVYAVVAFILYIGAIGNWRNDN